MSDTKLIIHKFEGGDNFKSLYVTIENGDNLSSEIKYSEWTEGTMQHKKKDCEKSSRLVVKIVSGCELNKLNLDSCAREVGNADKYLNMTSNSLDIHCEKFFNDYKSQHINFYKQDAIKENIGDGTAIDQSNFADDFKDTPEKPLQTYYVYKNNDTDSNNSHNTRQIINPLEQSLEKVKENNARIMENIHMLNKTLNYTKKKEILDIMYPKQMRSYSCETCGKCFVYETGLRRHYSMRHAMIEMQPRWQVVWTCIQCFQVWPQQDQAIKHSSECCRTENPDCIREIKTSSLLQCEYCEKVFTSIPRLIRHFKTHTTENNYECNACGLVFISYKTAEQHWLICPWLNMYYCFSLPKLLLCNACDRKFRNYEQLYNHRYKVGHFMMKTHCIESSVKSAGLLVYQCEMCGQWYSSVPQLKAHRSQNHPSVHNETSLHTRIDKNLSYDECYNMPAENNLIVNQIEDIHRKC